MGWISENIEEKVMKLVVNLFLPCFIVTSLLQSEDLKNPALVSIAFGSGVAIAVLGMAIAYFVGWVIRYQKGSGLRSFSLTCGIHNYGFIAIPMMISVYGELSDQLLGISFIHGIGVELAMWTLGVSLLKGNLTIHWKQLLNGPSLAILLSFALVYSGLDQWLPEALLSSAGMLAKCTFPMALLLIGAAMYQLFKNIQWEQKTIWSSAITRNLIIPLIYLGLGMLTPEGSNLRYVFVIQIAMPAAMMPILIAKHYGGHANTAIQTVSVSSIAAIVSIPVWILMGQHFLL